ncbi:MAG: hypothetical protein NVV66_01450 [Cellulomonas sp.]|uniref:replication initiator n=1 Tax=Cellulomonas sp. TaxID=40001 RepID=UPI002589C8F2|nr:replication initiator [Cellulomonas sp.]MCR6703402.1 hypothetical protein [Cellulomonas sp.]
MCTGAWTALDGEGVRGALACLSPLKLECRGCGEARRMACGTSRASKCEPCATVYRQRVARVAGSGLVVGREGAFVTLTAPGTRPHRVQRKGKRAKDAALCACTPAGGVDLADWNATLGKRWNRFVQDLAREVGAVVVMFDERGRRRTRLALRYFKAAEVQKRGALHLHVLVRREDGAPLVVRKRVLRALAIKHGFGHSVDVQPVETGHASYVAKYVAKSADERETVPWRARKWVRPKGRDVVLVRGTMWDRGTGEELGPPLMAESAHPTYRTWSASRAWGLSMLAVRADQRHFVMTLAELPAWATWAGKDCVPLRAASAAWARVAAPDRPDASVLL